jgi:hypothetical protein
MYSLIKLPNKQLQRFQKNYFDTNLEIRKDFNFLTLD